LFASHGSFAFNRDPERENAGSAAQKKLYVRRRRPHLGMNCPSTVVPHLRYRERAGRFVCQQWDEKQSAALRSSAAVQRRGTMEAIMPYLFWAVVPFEIMRIWWDACERRRDSATP
jgi:hypothetical protein